MKKKQKKTAIQIKKAPPNMESFHRKMKITKAKTKGWKVDGRG